MGITEEVCVSIGKFFEQNGCKTDLAMRVSLYRTREDAIYHRPTKCVFLAEPLGLSYNVQFAYQLAFGLVRAHLDLDYSPTPLGWLDKLFSSAVGMLAVDYIGQLDILEGFPTYKKQFLDRYPSFSLDEGKAWINANIEELAKNPDIIFEEKPEFRRFLYENMSDLDIWQALMAYQRYLATTKPSLNVFKSLKTKNPKNPHVDQLCSLFY